MDFRRTLMIFIPLALLTALFSATLFVRTSQAQGSDYSLRFYGHGVTARDLDRVKIRVDDPANSNPGPPADLGATDFTLEFWMKANASDNPAPAVSCGANVNWINGNTVFDRDRFNQDRKFGLSIAGGVFVFGVSGNGTGDRTICGTTNVLNSQWHHIAIERRRSDGWLWLYVDGVLNAQADGPDGDIAYPDNGVPGNYCDGSCTNSDPFLVIGAEKHDAGAQYPSYNGFIDEVRISNSLRYTANFARPSTTFGTDVNTIALYHMDEGPVGLCSTDQMIVDSSGASGGPSNGICKPGGAAPSGPVYTTDTPFSGASPTNTPLAPTATPISANTPVPGTNFALSFDGTNDLARANPMIGTGPLTIEAWVRPALSNAIAFLIAGADDNTGWSLELTNGRLTYWLSTNQGWQSIQHPTALVGGQWYHVAATYSAGSARVFVNGNAGTATSVGTLTQGPALAVGGLTGYPFFNGALDEVRISNVVRYAATFAVPTAPFASDANTLGLWHYDAGAGQLAVDTSVTGNNATLGATSAVGADDPTWVVGYPFTSGVATPTATNTPLPPTNTPLPPTNTPLPQTNTPLPITNTPLPPTNTSLPPTNTPLPPTATRTSTPLPSGNSGLQFDGTNDLASAGQVVSIGPLTIEAWVRPGINNETGLLIIGGDDNVGWSVELVNGRPTFWLATNLGWKSVQHTTALVGGQWYHIAATYSAGSARVFVNGNASTAKTVGTLTQGPWLRFGGLAGYPFYNGVLDEMRISNIARYTANFAPPASLALDANVIGLWRFNEGIAQTTVDASPSVNNAILGTTTGAETSDPTWVGVTR